MSKIIFKEESYKIIGCCSDVYKDKGCGFTDQVYQECLKIEFKHWKLPFTVQPKIEIEYRGQILKQYFVPDFICFDKIIIELKAVGNLIDVHRSQTMNYLNATNYDLALLVNFGHFPKIEYERFGNRKNSRGVKEESDSWSEFL